MIDREQMIEAAKTAINKYDKGIQYPAPYPDERDLGRGLMYALEDFIVFEQSSAPTDQDDREALEHGAPPRIMSPHIITGVAGHAPAEHPEPPIRERMAFARYLIAQRDDAESKLARIADLHGGWDTETNEATQADLVQKTLDIIYVDKEATR